MVNGGQLNNASQRISGSIYGNAGYAAGASSADLRRTVANGGRVAPLAPIANGMAQSDQNSRKRDRKTDWADFYRNGLPKEVIVIDDDSPEPQTRVETAQQAGQQHHQQQQNHHVPNGVTRHADKKRKTAASATYDPVYHQKTSYSTTQTPYFDGSPSQNPSTDGTVSALNTTAATSLGSNSSNAAYLPPLEDGVVGQKRKRTRRVAQDEPKDAKRRELDLHDPDPYSLYVPPPKPPLKSKDVYVQVVPDVSLLSFLVFLQF